VVTPPREAASRLRAAGADRRHDCGHRPDQGTHATTAAFSTDHFYDTLYGADPDPAGSANRCGPGPDAAERLSPLLTQPGPLFPGPRRAGPTYPASPVPAPIDQQKTQTYRNDLLNQRFQLDRQGVNPDNERYREIQRQLNQPSSR
jgi:hypothetical protein